MRNRFTAGLSSLALVLAAGCAAAPRPPAAVPDSDADVVHVAPPTGDRETDRASILGALSEVEPGGTVQFAPGTYLMGGQIIRITVPRITLAGHPEGSTLRGCHPGEFPMQDTAEFGNNCNGLELAGGWQTVRNLTFEHAFWALHVGCCWDGRPHMRAGEGGHLIEGNTFRSNRNAVRVHGYWSEPTVVRNNRFLNNWHSVAIYGNTVHLVDNDISAPEPEEVQGSGFPADGIHIAWPPSLHESAEGVTRTCENNVVSGNRIDGVTEGIMITGDDPQIICRNNIIRDNTIIIRRARPPVMPDLIRIHDEADSTVVGVPLALRGGLEDNLIEGNVIQGAEGLGIEIRRASRSRIVNNTISGVDRREPFPGNAIAALPVLGGDPEAWRDANGSGIWLSPGSDDNEIFGNTFEDIAASTVVIEGDSNRVGLRSVGDAVRDLGSGNRVTEPNAMPAAPEQAYTEWRPVASPDRAHVAALAYADGNVFAGTMAGLFASEDLGTSWQLRGPASRPISRLLPTAEGALLAGTYRQGILRSNDGGRTWRSVGFERNVYIQGLVQELDGRIYAAVRGAVEDEPTGVFRSSDDGRTWVASGLETEEIYSLSLPRPGLLFAGTRRGLFRSEDGGRTWSRMGALPSEAPVSKVMASGGHLYAAMGTRLHRIPGGGVARSADGRRSWEPTEGLPPGTPVLDLAVRAGTVFAAAGDVVHGGGRGLFRLDEAGTWRPAGLEDALLRELLETPDGLFAGAYELGVFHSADGRAWSHRSAGLRNWEPTALRFDAEGLLYALSVRSLFRSTDHGQSWAETPRPEGSAAPTPWSLAVDSSGALYLAGEGGVLVSSDRGESWESRPIPGEEGQVFGVTLDARGRLFAVVPGKAAYESSDVGRSWKAMELPATPRQALFSTPEGARLVTTADGTWRRTEGESWQAVAEEQVWDVVPCGDALIAGTYSRGLLRSTDDGRTWTPVTEGLRARARQAGYMTFTAVACLAGGGVLAGTFWDGVFYSADGGATWVDASGGLPSPTAQDFATAPDGQIFVATPAGVYRADFAGTPDRGD